MATMSRQIQTGRPTNGRINGQTCWQTRLSDRRVKLMYHLLICHQLLHGVMQMMHVFYVRIFMDFENMCLAFFIEILLFNFIFKQKRVEWILN